VQVNGVNTLKELPHI